MSYIGRGLQSGAFRQLDDISSGFDGSDTTHTMQVNSTNVTVGDVNQILLSLGGVIQKPGTDFTVSGSTLTFTTAPAANTSFFAILLGSDNGGTVTPTDGSVTGDKIASDLSIATNVTITTADNTDTLTLTSTDADASAGPNLRFYRNSSSPADDDRGGVIEFEGRNDNSQDVVYTRIETFQSDVSDGTEDAAFTIETMLAGTLRERMGMGTVATVFNDDSQDIDFRVESNHLTHALVVNAGINLGGTTGHGAVGVGVDPGVFFDCSGDLNNDVVARFDNSNDASGGGFPYGIQIRFTGTAPDNTTSYFFNCSDNSTDRFRIESDGDAQNHDNSYGSISDERIKQDIRDSNSQWDDIKAIKVRNYKKKDDVRQYGDKAWEQIGVIAQELEAAGMDKLVKESDPTPGDIASDASFGTLYEDGDTIPEGKEIGDVKEVKATVKGVSYSVLYMKAIKALQEAMAKIETLEADVKTLKGE